MAWGGAGPENDTHNKVMRHHRKSFKEENEDVNSLRSLANDDESKDLDPRIRSSRTSMLHLRLRYSYHQAFIHPSHSQSRHQLIEGGTSP